MSKSKILLLLAVFLLISPLSNLFTASAAPVVASGKCGPNLTWERTSDGVLTISGSGAMYDYDEATNPSPFYGVEVVIIGDEVTRIGEKAFFSISSLQKIIIGKCLTSIGDNAFHMDHGITEVHITALETWLNIDFEGSYSNPLHGYSSELYLNNERITDLVIPEGIKEIKKDAFYNYLQLQSVTIPASVTKIGDSAFSGCTSLSDVYITNMEAWCNIDFEDYGYSASNIGLVHLLYSNPLIYADNFWLNDKLVTDLVIPNGIKSVKQGAFKGYDKLKSVTFPSEITEIEALAFSGCTGLSNITLPESITTIENGVFSNCSNLTSITIPNGVTSIWDRAFSDCSNLTSIAIPSSVKKIGGGAFYKCEKLTNITIPEGVSSIEESLFSGCKSLNDVIIPKSVTSIGSSAFYGCSSLLEITIPDKVTSIGWSAFSGCSNLTEITIPDNVTSIGWSAFSNCSGLSEIILPDTLISIESNTFSNCTNLTTITIPQEITSIGYDAFNGCSKLSKIYYTGTAEDWDSIYIGTSNYPLKKATINYLPGKPLATDDVLVPLTSFEAEDGHEYAVKYGENIVSGDGVIYDYSKHGAYQIYFGKYASNTYKKPKAQGITINYTTNAGKVVAHNFTAKTSFRAGEPFGILIFGDIFKNEVTVENYIEY